MSKSGKREEAIVTVIEQAEQVCRDWAMMSMF